MKRKLYRLAMMASMLLPTPFAHATIIEYVANLNGSNELPVNFSPATGFAVITIDDVLNTMMLNVTFSGLLGATTVTHIHCCTATPLMGTVGVATAIPNLSGFPPGVMSGTYLNTLDMTQATSYNANFITANGGTPATAQAFLFNGISLGGAYLNIHTTQFPGGEIRGFLTQVPEPATLALIGIGMIGIGYQRRRGAKA